MYEVFGNFLKIDTWWSTHPNDVELFDKILSTIVDKPRFDPEHLGEFFFSKIDENNSNHLDAVDRYISRAETIREYIKNSKES